MLVTSLLVASITSTLAQVATQYTWSQAAGSYTAAGATGSNALFADGWDDAQTVVPIGFTFTFDGVAYTQVVVSSNGFIVFGNALNANDDGDAYVAANDASGLYLGGTATNNGVAAFNGDLIEQTFTSITGTRSTGSFNITGVSSTANLRIGMRLSGTGIPSNAVITNIAGTTVTMSVVATSNGTNTYTPRANAVAVLSGSAPNQTLTIQWTRLTRNTRSDDASFQIQLNEGGGTAANQ
ncbi:MAG TPA: hypothetical protein VKG92_03500, partial [Flavobacteriales bacterium]|nr:hypothetical protein [Flavobacteriales bacterium]